MFVHNLFVVSIHALTRSATRITFVLCFGCRCFNPRTHEECDAYFEAYSVTGDVSIHALTRSATCQHFPRWTAKHTGFNPRTHEECDLASSIAKIHDKKFQSTHSRGVRPKRDAWVREYPEFQSTHSRGVRQIYCCMTSFHICFNPRTHEECDVRKSKKQQEDTSFNPRTHEECDERRR